MGSTTAWTWTGKADAVRILWAQARILRGITTCRQRPLDDVQGIGPDGRALWAWSSPGGFVRVWGADVLIEADPGPPCLVAASMPLFSPRRLRQKGAVQVRLTRMTSGHLLREYMMPGGEWKPAPRLLIRPPSRWGAHRLASAVWWNGEPELRPFVPKTSIAWTTASADYLDLMVNSRMQAPVRIAGDGKHAVIPPTQATPVRIAPPPWEGITGWPEKPVMSAEMVDVLAFPISRPLVEDVGYAFIERDGGPWLYVRIIQARGLTTEILADLRVLP